VRFGSKPASKPASQQASKPASQQAWHVRGCATGYKIEGYGDVWLGIRMKSVQEAAQFNCSI